MPQVCTICTHPQAHQIDLALVRGVGSKSAIARNYRVDDDSLRRHCETHLAEKLRKALKSRTLREQEALLGVLDENMKHLGKLLRACDEYLRDPDDPDRYTLDPRAEQIRVVYDDPTGDTTKTGREIVRRKRASLQHLLNLVQEKLQVSACNVEVRHTDPRELILKTVTVSARTIKSLAGILGILKAPATNPEDVEREERQAHARMVGIYRAQQKRDFGRIISFVEAEIELEQMEAETQADLAELEQISEHERLWLVGE